MLSFEFKSARAAEMPDELEIWLDKDGLSLLQSGLEMLARGKKDHIHLMAKAWGGDELDDQPQSAKAISIKHVKVYFRGP